jgi:hypothetical protein
MIRTPTWILIALIAAGPFVAGCRTLPKQVDTDPAVRKGVRNGAFDVIINNNAASMLDEGREIFRHETFGSEEFWGGQLKLHQAIAGEAEGGVGPGLTARQALQLGLKVDIDRLPALTVQVLREGSVGLDRVETTLELLRADAVVGVKGFFDEKRDRLTSVGITCAFCHSTVNDGFMKGIGERLDGWPNRDLNVGEIVLLAPNLEPMSRALGKDLAEIRKVLKAWGPGKYDAEFNIDGMGFRPDGKTAATVIPAAFGLAGVNLHTYEGWGTVTYWNAYVANTQMYGKGVFYDPRLSDAKTFPLAVRQGFDNKRSVPDLTTSKLGPLHYYQLSIPAPKPKEETYDRAGAERGRLVFEGKAQCATCHVPPLYCEPGWSMHTPEEIGIDAFQADRSPDKRYRTTPLRGLFTRSKGGFYHDGRFADLGAVVDHYDRHRKLGLTAAEKGDLIEFLKSL